MANDRFTKVVTRREFFKTTVRGVGLVSVISLLDAYVGPALAPTQAAIVPTQAGVGRAMAPAAKPSESQERVEPGATVLAKAGQFSTGIGTEDFKITTGFPVKALIAWWSYAQVGDSPDGVAGDQHQGYGFAAGPDSRRMRVAHSRHNVSPSVTWAFSHQ